MLIFLKVHLHQSKVKKSRFFLVFCLMTEGSASVQIMTDPDLGGPEHTDPDSQHQFNSVGGFGPLGSEILGHLHFGTETGLI
jgi:hypothetical protein